MKKRNIILCIFIGLLLVTGCGKVPQLENGQEVIVELEGVNITVDELYNKMKDQYARDILIDLIDEAILEQEYETDEILTAQINREIDYIKMQTEDNFLQAIKGQWGLNSEEELFDFIKISLKRNMAIESYAETLISDKEINEYYEKETVGDIQTSHILIKPDVSEGMTDEEIAEAEQTAYSIAEDLIKKLDNGADFSELAEEYSKDEGSAGMGGDLGWFNKGRMVEAFEQAAYRLKIDTYTKTPVTSEFGYHIILKTGEKEKPTLEEAKPNILKLLVDDKLTADQTLSYEALEKLREKYNLVIHDSNLNKQYNDHMKELKEQEGLQF